jgi:hypothetical protein
MPKTPADTRASSRQRQAAYQKRIREMTPLQRAIRKARGLGTRDATPCIYLPAEREEVHQLQSMIRELETRAQALHARLETRLGSPEAATAGTDLRPEEVSQLRAELAKIQRVLIATF